MSLLPPSNRDGLLAWRWVRNHDSQFADLRYEPPCLAKADVLVSGDLLLAAEGALSCPVMTPGAMLRGLEACQGGSSSRG